MGWHRKEADAAIERIAKEANERTDMYEFINQYETLRERCHEVAKNSVVLGADNAWLRTAFSNAGPEGIYQMEASGDGIKCWATCWTSQTGGSTEYVEFTVPYSALEA